jgi:hypothetical protein
VSLENKKPNDRLAACVLAACVLAGGLLVASCAPAPRTATGGHDQHTPPPCAPGNLACVSPTPAAPAGIAQAASTASAGTPDFALVNFTGQTLHAVYISPHNSTGWEENVLGRDQLFNGETVEVSFSPAEQSVNWDLRVEDADGRHVEWKNLNLREISTIKLRLNARDKTVTAEAE